VVRWRVDAPSFSAGGRHRCRGSCRGGLAGALGVKHSWTGFGEKKLLDWLHLLIIPTVLGTTVLWFNYNQGRSERNIAAE
jgi:hypothetical protein